MFHYDLIKNNETFLNIFFPSPSFALNANEGLKKNTFLPLQSFLVRWKKRKVALACIQSIAEWVFRANWEIICDEKVSNSLAPLLRLQATSTIQKKRLQSSPVEKRMMNLDQKNARCYKLKLSYGNYINLLYKLNY